MSQHNAIRNAFIENYGIYNRIQDHLMLLGNRDNLAEINAVLILYVQRTAKNRPGTDNKYSEYYYSEVSYLSERFNTDTKKIRRRPDFFLSLENVRNLSEYHEFITIRPKDMELMYIYLLPYFESVVANFDTIYETRANDKLYVNEEKSLMIDIGYKPIVFKCGINKNFTDDLVPTIDMFLNGNPKNKVSMNFDQVYNFMHFIRRFNCYTYMNTMLNFIGRPPAGTNMIDMTYGQQFNVVIPNTFTDPSKNRLAPVPETRTVIKSYFNTHKGNNEE